MMDLIVLDFESYYDKDYSLRKMTPVDYILDPRFECMGCAVIDPVFYGEQAVWLDADNFGTYVGTLKQLRREGRRITTITHNALFDNCVLAWRYGMVPDLMIDTMSMSRALLYAFTGYVSLEKIAAHLQLPPKGNVIKNVSGMRAVDIKTAGLWREYTAYARHDAYLCGQIFEKLYGQFPAHEFDINDMVIRAAVQPRFKLDLELLAEHKWNIAQHKGNLLMQCGLVAKSDLMSNEKFAMALHTLGVTPGTKVSAATGKDTYAFAKSDPFMIGLAEHDDDRVQALVAARVGHKSTLEESRTERLISIAQARWPDGSTGWAPIPLRFSGAHTHRLSGYCKINPQNWSKYNVQPDGSKTTGKLRLAHKAPRGYKVVKADSSQIEARLVAWLAGQDDLVQAFADKKDIYSEFASEEIFHRPVTRADVDERFVGKNTILGAGFGMGPLKFQTNVAAVSYTALGRSVKIDLETATAAIAGYRRRFPHIPQTWAFLNRHIPTIARTDSEIGFGPVRLEHQAILLPNGLRLFYRELHWEQVPGAVGGGEWWFWYGRQRKKLFGGKLYENIVQSLARIITMNAALRMRRRFPGVHGCFAHQEHDALSYIVPDDMVSDVAEALEECMTKSTDWYRDLPLACEVGIGQSYGEAK